MPEKTRWKNGDGNEGLVGLVQGDAVRRQRHFTHIKLAKTRHAKEGFLHRQVQVVQVNAIDRYRAIHQGARTVIVPACKAQFQSTHTLLLLFDASAIDSFAQAFVFIHDGTAILTRTTANGFDAGVT